MKAVWNNTVIAQSDETTVIEGNHYIPPETVRTEILQDSDTTTVCPWKGTANYYNIEVNGEVNQDAAWYYPEPKDAASEIRGRVAFRVWIRIEYVSASAKKQSGEREAD